MIYPGNALLAEPNSRFRVRRALSAATYALAVVVAALQVSPALAQGSSTPTVRNDAPVRKTVKPSGPANRSRSAGARGSNKQKVMVPSRVVLVFPTDTKGGVSDQLSDVITEIIQGRISASGRYQSVYFLRSIPTVGRALNEATLTVNEVSHPFDDDIKLRKLIPNTGYDMALTTSIDSYTYDSAKNQVTLLISARLIDYRGAKPVVRAAAENGSSPENGGNARELVLATQVAKTITEKLMTSLLAQGASSAAAPGK